MSEWEPKIVRIEKIEKHPGADLLEIATVLGDYPVIIKTGQYKVNDLAAYIQIDSVVPDTEKYHFLSPKLYEHYEENGSVKQRQVGLKYQVGFVPEKYRIIKAKNIRGVYSMGMLVDCPEGLKEGDSVVEKLNLTKWVEPVDDEVEYNGVKISRGKNAESPPKGWSIPYYDIDSVRKYLKSFLPNEEVVLLEKLNGSNSSFVYDGNKLWIKSRNYFKKFDEQDMWVEAAIRYDLEKKLSKYPMFAFFAECIGQVKNYRYGAQIVNGRLQTKLYFFDILNLSTMKYLDYEESLSIINELGLDYAPELYKGIWKSKEEMYPYAEGKTLIQGGANIREGFVMKPLKERFDKYIGGRFQLKLVSEQHTLNK